MFRSVRTAVIVYSVLTLITGVVYPLVITGVSQVLFHDQANGSVLLRGETAVGSSLIGQAFDDPRYFWGRPSATSPAYNGAASSGSNLGPTNPALLDAVAERVSTLRAAHPTQTGAIPGDLVTASASGLDPHISPAAAQFQIDRVATARGLPVDQITALVAAHTQSRTFGMLGEPRVNVLELNLALDTVHRP
ncbi:MAG: potassium-transporting ATPase subunit KdpC [Planctomycetia bacterium]|nr:potassium-transporting ATPase subunit KdpC [Planctomycetia bacterium]